MKSLVGILAQFPTWLLGRLLKIWDIKLSSVWQKGESCKWAFLLGPRSSREVINYNLLFGVNVFNVVYNVYGWLFGKLHLTIWSFGQSLMVLMVETSPGVTLRWFHAMKCLESSSLSFLIICGCFPKVMWVIFQNVLSGQWRFKCERGRVWLARAGAAVTLLPLLL